MASFNKIFLMGNLTRDPELRYTSGGLPICTLGLAVNHRTKSQNNENKEEVLFINVTVWGKSAENCNEYLNKGKTILVEGRLRQNNWEGEDGQKRSKFEVVADNVQFLSPRSGGSRSEGGEARSEPGPDHCDSGDDIPF